MSDITNMYKLTDPQDKKVLKKKGSALQIERMTGRTAAAVNQMPTMDVLSAMPNEILGKVLSYKLSPEADAFRRSIASVFHAERLADALADYNTLKELDERWFDGTFEDQQFTYDEQHDAYDPSDPSFYYLQRPTLLDFTTPAFMEGADFPNDYDESLYEENSDYPQKPSGNKRLPVHRVVHQDDYYDTIRAAHERFGHLRPNEQELDNLQRQMEERFGDSIFDYLDEQDIEFGELEGYATDRYFQNSIYGPFTDLDGTYNQPFYTTSTHVGKRQDFQANMVEINQELSTLLTRSANEFQEFDEDEVGADEVLGEPRNLGEFNLAFENWQKRYDETPNEDMTEEERDLNEEIENLGQQKDELMNIADETNPHTYVLHKDSYERYAQELTEYHDTYRNALQTHMAIADGVYQFSENDFGRYGRLNELSDEDKLRVRQMYVVNP